MIVTPEISWIAILPEVILGLAAAIVLLVEVQWKPHSRVLGTIAAGAVVFAAAVTVVQWIQSADATELGQTGELIAFSGLIVMDGFAIFGRITLLAITGFFAVCLATVVWTFRTGYRLKT